MKSRGVNLTVNPSFVFCGKAFHGAPESWSDFRGQRLDFQNKKLKTPESG
jgi:hypothetical protein